MRKIEFQNGEYYHIFNRGVDGRNVFECDKDYFRFLESMREFNIVEPIGSLYIKKKLNNATEAQRGSTPFRGVEPLRRKLVTFFCFCLNKNHFHFLLQQSENKGISEFMKRLSGGYTCYFNQKYKRFGSLFQGKFKAIHVDSDGYLLWLSAYINGNPEIHGICKAKRWIWSSCRDYLGLRNGNLCDKREILSEFTSVKDYKDFLGQTIKDSKEIKGIKKKFLLE